MSAVSLIESVSTFLRCETTRSSLQTKQIFFTQSIFVQDYP